MSCEFLQLILTGNRRILFVCNDPDGLYMPASHELNKYCRSEKSFECPCYITIEQKARQFMAEGLCSYDQA